MALVDPIKESRGGDARMRQKPTVEEMERALGLDKTGVIYIFSLRNFLTRV